MKRPCTPAWGRWYVASTRPRREEFARVMLEQQGLEVFLPVSVLEWSTGRGRMREQVRHLFPGYLFVRMAGPADYPKVKWAPGVRRLLGAAMPRSP